MAQGQAKLQEAESRGIQTPCSTASQEWEEGESPSYRERSFAEGNRVYLQKAELQVCFQIETPEPKYLMLPLCMLKLQRFLSHGVPRVAKQDGTAWTWDKTYNISFQNKQFNEKYCHWYCWLGVLPSPTPISGQMPSSGSVLYQGLYLLIAWKFRICDG